jgi:hypothetical protein
LKCNNINVNVNDFSLNVRNNTDSVGGGSIGGAASLSPQSLTDDGTNHNGFKKFDKDFVFICKNNNNNTSTTTPGGGSVVLTGCEKCFGPENEGRNITPTTLC